MAVSKSFRDFVLEQFGHVFTVTSRPMMGGVTLFHEGRAFALIDEDRVYLKVDDSNRQDFLAADRGPFLPFGDANKPMAYFELPEELLDDPDALAPWLHKARDVARRGSGGAKRRR